MGVEQPIPVPQGIVETLVVAATESSGTLERFALAPTSRLARRFAFCLGHSPKPFVELVHLDDRGRVRVFFEFMGGEVSARLDRSRVAPAA